MAASFVSPSPIAIPFANMVGGMANLLLNQQVQTMQQCTNPQYFYVPLDSSTPGNFYPVAPLASQSQPQFAALGGGRFYCANPASSPSPVFQGGNLYMYAVPGISVTIMSSASSAETLGHSYAWSGWATSYQAVNNSGQLGQYYESYQSQSHRVDSNADHSSLIYSGSCSQSSFTPIEHGGSMKSDFVPSAELQRAQFHADPDVNGFCLNTASFDSLERDEPVTATGAFGPVRPPQLRRSQSCVQNMMRYCKFCKRNGETRQFYETHVLGNKNQIQCPILQKYVCPVCQATGEKAHTLRYCPANRDASGIVICPGRCPKSGRTSTGIRHRYVTV